MDTTVTPSAVFPDPATTRPWTSVESSSGGLAEPHLTSLASPFQDTTSPVDRTQRYTFRQWILLGILVTVMLRSVLISIRYLFAHGRRPTSPRPSTGVDNAGTNDESTPRIVKKRLISSIRPGRPTVSFADSPPARWTFDGDMPISRDENTSTSSGVMDRRQHGRKRTRSASPPLHSHVDRPWSRYYRSTRIRNDRE
ncbi:hypothetical protein QBC35DRAFT_527166 [Podospora australis]|uniref:Uncharacterized protein n=1 Tax=Podospora australis TaxID=1536484 RepID=A0AAN7AQF9_9PEZI|nr:hypothetical protein QBC35DRAFT_527166 [Podospora australis]